MSEGLQKLDKSQIEKGFEALTNKFTDIFNRPLPDDPEKRKIVISLDKAFEDFLQYKISEHIGEVLDIPDEVIFNIIGNAFSIKPCKSFEEVFSVLRLGTYGEIGDSYKDGDIERIGKDKWKIRDINIFKKLEKALKNSYREATR